MGAIVGALVAPVAGPRNASAQQANVPVVGVLGGAGNDADGQARLRLFNQALQSLGRFDGRNVQLDVRLVGNDPVRIRANAAELVRANPAMILAIGTPVLVALRELTRSIPIVFAIVSIRSTRICR
jgi:putative ABC transport system substrate-binding protein